MNTIEPVKIFTHSFSISRMKDQEFRDSMQWCSDNIEGQWMSIGHPNTNSIRISYYSGPKHKLSKNESYPPSIIDYRLNMIISFELESDSVAYKLKWEVDGSEYNNDDDEDSPF